MLLTEALRIYLANELDPIRVTVFNMPPICPVVTIQETGGYGVDKDVNIANPTVNILVRQSSYLEVANTAWQIYKLLDKSMFYIGDYYIIRSSPIMEPNGQKEEDGNYLFVVRIKFQIGI